MLLLSLKKLSATGAMLLAITAGASAVDYTATQTGSTSTSVTYSASMPTTRTDFTNVFLLFNKFNGPGTLTSVSFSIQGTVTGTIGLENLSDDPQTIMGILSAELTLKRPDLSTLVLTLPTVTRTFTEAPGFDDLDDKGGLSGRTYSNLTSTSQSGILTSSTAFDLALFTGTGTINLPLSGIAKSNAANASNVSTSFVSRAFSTATITYNYSLPVVAVPEPSTWIAAAGLVGISGLRLRRRRA